MRLLLLSHLENFNRLNILALWDQPFCRSEPPTQETMAAESEDEDEDQCRAEEAVFAALDLFSLHVLPTAEAQINDAFKAAMRKAHPDRNFGSCAATDHVLRLSLRRRLVARPRRRGEGARGPVARLPSRDDHLQRADSEGLLPLYEEAIALECDDDSDGSQRRSPLYLGVAVGVLAPGPGSLPPDRRADANQREL